MSKVMIEMEMPKNCRECEFYIIVNEAVHIGSKCKRLPIKDMDGDLIDYQVICKTLDQARKLLEVRDQKCPLQEVKESERMNDWQDRLVKEYKELKEKYNALHKAIIACREEYYQ